jgi:hypothetical protein
MEKEIKIVFDIPKHIQSEFDGIVILYPYQIFSIEEFKQTDNSIYNIKIMIPGRIVDKLGFQIWQPLENTNIMKLFLSYVIEEIKKAIKEKMLSKYIEFIIPMDYHHNESIQIIDSLPDVEGYKINLTINEESNFV